MTNLICKHNPKANFSPVYLIMDKEVIVLGSLSEIGLNKLIELNTLCLIDSVEIIEKFFFSEAIISGVQNHIYYSFEHDKNYQNH